MDKKCTKIGRKMDQNMPKRAFFQKLIGLKADPKLPMQKLDHIIDPKRT